MTDAAILDGRRPGDTRRARSAVLDFPRVQITREAGARLDRDLGVGSGT